MNGTDPTRREIDPAAANGSANGASANGAGAEGQTPGPWGIRRLEVAQPPATPWAASAVVSPDVPAQRDRDARSAPPAEPGDPDPITTELFNLPLFAIEPPKPHSPVAPAPAAWRTVPTSAVLKAILPPTEFDTRPAPPQSTVATAVRVAMIGAGATPGTAIQDPAGRSVAATLAVPGAVVGVSPWPEEVGAGTEPTAAPKPSLRRRVLWEILMVIGIAITVAIIYEALSVFLNGSPGLGSLGGLIVLSSTVVRSPLYESSSWTNASRRNGEGEAGSKTRVSERRARVQAT